MVAGVTGGPVLSGIGRAVGAFDRIQAEIGNAWQLGVESTGQDADGRTHKIDGTVRREGVTVRARREDFPLTVALRKGVALQFSDLFIGDTGDRFTPAIAVRAARRGLKPAPCKECVLESHRDRLHAPVTVVLRG